MCSSDSFGVGVHVGSASDAGGPSRGLLRVRVSVRIRSLPGTGGSARVDVDAKIQGGVRGRGGFAIVVEAALVETSVLGVVASAQRVQAVG